MTHPLFRIAATELQVEWRSRRVSTTMLLLSTLVVLVFAFAGGGAGIHPAVTAFWVALALAAAAGTVQWAARSHGSGVAAAWHAMGVGAASAYAGQALALTVTLLAVALPLGLVTAALFDALGALGLLWALLDVGLGTVALAALSAALLPGLTKQGARLGALLVLPLCAPVLLTAGRATRADLLLGRPGTYTMGLALVAAALIGVGLLLAWSQGLARSAARRSRVDG